MSSCRQTLEYLKQIDINNTFTVFGYLRQIEPTLTIQTEIPKLIIYLCLSYYFHGEYFDTVNKKNGIITISNGRMSIARKPIYKPGQRRDPPHDSEGSFVFYDTLYKENPTSEMAEIWLMENGCFDLDKQAILAKKYGRKHQLISSSKPHRFPLDYDRLQNMYDDIDINEYQSYGTILIPSNSNKIAKWKFKINKMIFTNSIRISVVDAVYYSISNRGVIRSNDDHVKLSWVNGTRNRAFSEGDVVTFLLNTMDRNICFAINDDDECCIFESIQKDDDIEYKIGVQLLDRSAKVSLLNFSLTDMDNFDI